METGYMIIDHFRKDVTFCLDKTDICLYAYEYVDSNTSDHIIYQTIIISKNKPTCS